MSEAGRIANALWGAWRLANFDRSGFDRFEVTAGGFWHSFLAAAVGLPLFAVHAFLERETAEVMLTAVGRTPVFGPFYLNAAVDYVLMWPAFALLMIPLTRIAGVADRYAGLIIAYNWSRIVAMVIRLPVMLLVVWGRFGTTALTVALMLTYGLILAYQWYVGKIALGTGLAAAVVVLADLVLGVAIASLAALVLGDPILVSAQ